MIEQKHPEYEEVERQVTDIERKLSIVHLCVGDYRENVEKINTYYRLVDEVSLIQYSLISNHVFFMILD